MRGPSPQQRRVLDVLRAAPNDLSGVTIDLVDGGGVQLGVHDNLPLAYALAKAVGVRTADPLVRSFSTFATVTFADRPSELHSGGVEVMAYERTDRARRRRRTIHRTTDSPHTDVAPSSAAQLPLVAS